MGFPTPLRQWLLDASAAPPLRRSHRANDSLLASYLDPAAKSPRCSTATAPAREDATDRIWRLLNLANLGRRLPHRPPRPLAGMASCRLPKTRRHCLPPYEAALGQDRFSPSHHQGRPHPHARNAQATCTPATKSTTSPSTNRIAPKAPPRSGEYSSFHYAVPHRIVSKRSPLFAAQLAAGLFTPLPVARRPLPFRPP